MRSQFSRLRQLPHRSFDQVYTAGPAFTVRACLCPRRTKGPRTAHDLLYHLQN